MQMNSCLYSFILLYLLLAFEYNPITLYNWLILNFLSRLECDVFISQVRMYRTYPFFCLHVRRFGCTRYRF